MHELKGPLELTVAFPSGRTWRTAARKADAKTDDHHWPKLDDPPETRTPNLESITVPIGEFSSWDLALDASLRLAEQLGVEQRFRDETEQRIRKKPVQFPNYPLEGCLTLTTVLLKKGSVWLLEAQLFVQPRGMHRIEGWPDTCRADAGAP
jgi:hypothetical protein